MWLVDEQLPQLWKTTDHVGGDSIMNGLLVLHLPWTSKTAAGEWVRGGSPLQGYIWVARRLGSSPALIL